ncbi:unnamed protein product, partial [Musa banksii]
MFPHALLSVMTLSSSRFDATFATLMSFGWSQPDSIAAFRRHPGIWNLSKKNLCDKMTFLMKEAGCELTYIIYRPVLLTYSLEKRLRPRYEVMNFLDQNKLLDKGHNLQSVVKLSEEKFRNKFLFLLRKENFIAQYDSYVVAVQGKRDIMAFSRKFFTTAEAIDVTGRPLSGPGERMRTATTNSHPCPKCSGETVSSTATATAAFSLAKGGSSGRIFLRRALIAAAFSSENGGCCGFFLGER